MFLSSSTEVCGFSTNDYKTSSVFSLLTVAFLLGRFSMLPVSSNHFTILSTIDFEIGVFSFRKIILKRFFTF